MRTAKKGTKGKERARETKGKGAKAGEDGSDGSEGEDGEEEEQSKGDGGAATTTIDPLDTFCNDAIFGYCRVNLFQPPAPLHFGQFNRRPLVEARAKKFAANIGGTNVRPFARSHMLPLVISKDDVEQECYELNPNVERSPFLKLKAGVAQRPRYGLKFAGGRHRHRAMEILLAKSKEVVAGLRDKLTDSRKALGEMQAGQKRHQSMQEKIVDLEEKLKVEQEVERNVSVWGVVLYDESE